MSIATLLPFRIHLHGLSLSFHIRPCLSLAPKRVSCVVVQQLSCVQLFSDPMDCMQPARLLCSWDFTGKNTGVSCHVLLQGSFHGMEPVSPAWQVDSSPLSHQGSPTLSQAAYTRVFCFYSFTLCLLIVAFIFKMIITRHVLIVTLSLIFCCFVVLVSSLWFSDFIQCLVWVTFSFFECYLLQDFGLWLP